MKTTSFITKSLLISLFIPGFLLGCKKNSTETEIFQVEEPTGQITEKTLTKLSAESEEVAGSWRFFKEFENDLKLLSHENIKSYYAIVERMVTTSDSLFVSIPEPINNKIILSRTRVLNTRVKLLNQAIKQQNKQATNNHLNELYIAYNHLVNQMNVRFEKIKIDETTQIEVYVKDTDSIPATD